MRPALIASSRRPARAFRRVAPPAGLSLPARASGPHSCLLLLPSPPAPDVSLTFETSPACCLPPPHIEPGYAAHQRCLCSKPTHNRPKRERHARDPLEQLRSFRLRLRVNCHGRVTVIRPGNLSPSHYIPMCSGVRPDQITNSIVPLALYKGAWSDRTTLLSR